MKTGLVGRGGHANVACCQMIFAAIFREAICNVLSFLKNVTYVFCHTLLWVRTGRSDGRSIECGEFLD